MKLRNLAFQILLVASLSFSACTNLEEGMGDLSTLNPNVIPSNLNIGGSTTHNLSRVTVTQDTSSSSNSNNYILSLSVDTSLANFKSLNEFCGVGGVMPCLCELKWNETNTAGSTEETVARVRRLPVVEVQPGIVKCQLESSFYSEIPESVSIVMKVIPNLRQGNTTSLNVESISFKKGTAITDNGDFFDETLTPFKNIHRYTCHTKRQAVHEVLNGQKEQEIPNADGNTTMLMTASGFCTESGSGAKQKICQQPRSGYSAQSYYRNLFVASDKIGDINATNNSYECPQVLQSLKADLTGSSQTSTLEKAWPLDSTFALATARSPDWSVGVEATSVLAVSGDPDSIPQACVGTDPTKRFADSGVVTKCLGYAKKPKADGSCGVMRDEDGNTRPLVRLRRYRAVFPPYFNAKGEVLDDRPIEADEVYVPDRVVLNAQGNYDGNMIYGPKPCNISWFDHEGMTKRAAAVADDFESSFINGIPSYVGTNRYKYIRDPNDSTKDVFLNPDGLIFPNKDSAGTPGSGGSCSAALPLIDRIMGVPSRAFLTTTHSGRTNDYVTVGQKEVWLSEVHVRPVEPWTPNYVEDTGFQACVPASDPYIEPPLHLYSNTVDGEEYMSWCAKVYPTQNPYWYELNRKRKVQASTSFADNVVGWPNARKVDNFTSHKTNDATHKTFGVTGSCYSYTGICSSTVTAGNLNSCRMFLNEDGAAGDRKDILDPSIVGDVAATGRYCDRTVKYDPLKDFRGFPLQASDDDVKSMLKKDSVALEGKNFSCTFSFHSDKSKVGKNIPASGCCGVVSGTAVLDTILDGAEHSAHMEPYKNNDYPNLRYCGNPVE